MSTTEQKEYYDIVQELTLAHCYDPNVLATNQEKMYRFHVQHGIPEGVAWHYVYGIGSFWKQQKGQRAHDRSLQAEE